MVELSYSRVQHVSWKQLLHELQFFVFAFFVKKYCFFRNHVNLVIHLLERFEFLKTLFSESIVDFKGSIVRVEVKKGFVFVDDDEIVAGREIIDKALIVI